MPADPSDPELPNGVEDPNKPEPVEEEEVAVEEVRRDRTRPRARGRTWRAGATKSWRSRSGRPPRPPPGDPTLPGMGHGAWLDHVEPMWPANKPQPWEPPLTDAGVL